MTGLTQAEAAMLDTIEAQPILDRTLTWAKINSGTGNLDGLATVADLLVKAYSALPGEIELVEPAPVEAVDARGAMVPVPHGRHMVLRVRPDAQRRVLLTGHMDTVFAKDHPFQDCTWLEDGKVVNGPGTADMKAGLSLILAGLQAYETTGPALGYDVLINSDEETGSKSSAALIAQLADGKIAALTFEPALPDGSMARARSGSGNYAAIVAGRSAHAGRNPQDGRNAIVAAADLALRLKRDCPDGSTLNPARIDGGGPNNAVPDLAILHFNVRSRDPDAVTAAEAHIRAALDAVAKEHEVAIGLRGGFGRPPKPIDARAQGLFDVVRQAAADLGESIDWHDTGGVCDGNNIAATGVPVIDTMGALGGSIHSSDEFLMVDSLVTRAKLCALTLHRLEKGNSLP